MAVNIVESRSLCEVVSSLSESSLKDAARLMPGFISDMDRLRINAVEMEGDVEDGRPVFKFRFRWTSSSKETKQNWDELINQSPALRWGGLIQCDGGCHKRVPATQVEQFGSCDHNVCLECLHTRKAVFVDGTPGCPNPRCVGIRSKSVSRSSSRSDVSNGLFMVNLRFLVFSLERGVMGRKVTTCEMTSGHDLFEVKKTLENLVSDIEKSRIYYTTTEKFHRKDLVQLRLKEMDGRRLETLSEQAEHLTIVVARPGVNILV